MKLGRPAASSATTSPSTTAGLSPKPGSIAVSSGYRAVMSVPLRARSVRRSPSQVPIARMPSHLNSTHGSPHRFAAALASAGVDGVASIGASAASGLRRLLVV